MKMQFGRDSALSSDFHDAQRCSFGITEAIFGVGLADAIGFGAADVGVAAGIGGAEAGGAGLASSLGGLAAGGATAEGLADAGGIASLGLGTAAGGAGLADSLGGIAAGGAGAGLGDASSLASLGLGDAGAGGAAALPAGVANANAGILGTTAAPAGTAIQPAAAGASAVSAPAGVSGAGDVTAAAGTGTSGANSIAGQVASGVNAGNLAAGSGSTSIGDLVGKAGGGVLDSLTKNPLGIGLGVAGLGYNIYEGKQQTKNQQALQADAAQATSNSNQLTSSGEALQTYLTSGTLPPQYMAQVQQALQDAKTSAISNAAAQGLPTDPTKNTALAATLAKIDASEPGMISQVAGQLFSSGSSLVSAGQSAAGLSGQLYSTLVNNDTAQAANTGKAIATLAQALNGKSSATVGNQTITVGQN